MALLSQESVDAVTLDFYNTLVYHKEGSGRGAVLMDYLRAEGLESDPWEHQVLYDVFQHHREEYSASFTPEHKERYLVRLTERLFTRLNVLAPAGAETEHAAALWEVTRKRLRSSLAEALRGEVDPKTIDVKIEGEESSLVITVSYVLAAIEHSETQTFRVAGGS